MSYSNSVRQNVPAPKNSIIGGALQGLAGSLQKGVDRNDASKAADAKNKAAYLIAMAQQGRGVSGGDTPAWLQGTEFEGAPVDYQNMLDQQEFQNYDPNTANMKDAFGKMSNSYDPAALIPYANQLPGVNFQDPESAAFGRNLTPPKKGMELDQETAFKFLGVVAEEMGISPNDRKGNPNKKYEQLIDNMRKDPQIRRKVEQMAIQSGWTIGQE